VSPECIFELVLDIEQPDPDRGGEKRDRHLNKQELLIPLDVAHDSEMISPSIPI
jgi:hypothetical protein